jgi:hypothetical protein
MNYIFVMTEEGGREVVRRRMERNEGEEGEREAVRKRMERKGEKGSEEDDYFNKFPPTMPSVVLPPHYLFSFL